MDCDSLHLDLSSLSWESVWQTQCEEKAWLTVVCLTVLLCTLYTCIGCSSLTVSSKISAWHVPVCESVWLQSPIRDCFTYCCLRCYGHGGEKTLWKMTTLMPQVRVRGGGGKISLMVFTWRQPPCCEHRFTVTVYGWTSSYPKGLLTRIGLMLTYKRLRAKSGKLRINTYLANCER